MSASNVILRFKVPTVQDKAQENFIGLLNFEIEKAKHEMTTKINIAKSDIQNHMESKLDTDVSAMKTSIESAIDDIKESTVITINDDSDIKVTDYNNYAISELALKADQDTVNALDEFAKVVNSALDIEYTGYNGYTGVKQNVINP
jgi:hypothetical protein